MADRQLTFAAASLLLGQLTEELQKEESKIQLAQRRLDERAAKLEAAEAAFAQEKKQMLARGTADNDVLDLNVSGTLLSVKRSTLTQVDGTLLSSMFSGRWEGSCDKDSQGRYFLDFEPYCFQEILTFLRCRTLMPGQQIAAPAIANDRFAAFKCLVDYLGLEQELSKAVSSAPSTDQACHFTGVSDSAFVAKAMADGQWVDCASVWESHTRQMPSVAVSMPSMSAGQVYYAKVARTQSMPSGYYQNSDSYFVGIAKATLLATSTNFGDNKSVYGWDLHTVWKGGVHSDHGYSVAGPTEQAGTPPLVQLDLLKGQFACAHAVEVSACAVARQYSGWKMTVPIPDAADAPYCFMFGLSVHAATKLLPVTEKDRQLFADQSQFFDYQGQATHDRFGRAFRKLKFRGKN